MRASPIALAACFLAAASAPALPQGVHSSISYCGLEGEMRVEQRGERAFMIVYLHPDADYDKVACFLEQADRLGLDLGFVGNQAYQ